MGNWRPASGPEVAQHRAAMLQRIRHRFAAQQVLEVDTAALSHAAVSDVQIESLEVKSGNSRDATYLHTSPEFMMKRMLADGWPDIYSIARVFRDGECGARHQPEFTLLEWYRLDLGLTAIIGDSIEVIAIALDAPALVASAEVVDYRDVFLGATGLDPARASIDEIALAAGADTELRAALGSEHDDWLDLLMATSVSTGFATDRLTVVRHYPVAQAALARLCPEDPTVADRFEIFMGTLELGNGYVELTDAKEQAARIEADQAGRRRRGRRLRPHDETLVNALEHGLPDCAGVAIGLERLQMIYEKTDDIRHVIPFPFENHDA